MIDLIGKLISVLGFQQGFVPAILAYLIIALFICSCISLTLGVKCLQKSLEFAIDLMQREAGNDRNWVTSNEDNFRKLKNIFDEKECRILEHYWKEFAECVVEDVGINDEDDETRDYVNTEPASSFFNFNTIVVQYEDWLFKFSFSFFESVPTILTGLGILGTFIGIIQGLPDSLDLDQQLPAFLSGMKAAFITSIMGLGLGVAFTVFERYLFGHLEKKVNKLASQIDLVFRRKTQQHCLEKIEEYNRKQYDAVRNLSMEIGQEVVKGITDGGINTAEISNSMKEGVSNGFYRLAGILDGLLNAQEGFVNSANEIHEKYREISLSATDINKATEACSNNLKVSSQGFTSSAEALASANETLVEATRRVTATIEEQKESNEAITKATSSTHEALNQLTTSKDQFLKEYKTVFDEFASHVDKYNETNTNTLKNNLKMFDEELGGGLNKWRNNINGLKDLLDDLKPAIHGLHECIVQLNKVTLDQQEADQQEVDQQEADQQEVDQQEVDQQEVDQQEADQQEADQQEADQKKMPRVIKKFFKKK